MARTGGDRTRSRILAEAERLFSAKGFDATSVSEIAAAARVNKALIYYHFENKDDLVLRLLEAIVEEVSDHVEARAGAPGAGGEAGVRRELREELEFLAGRKRILSVLLAEAFRSSHRDEFLFRCAELAARRGHAGDGSRGGRKPSRGERVHEFFTGFLPLIAFVALRDKWCKHHGEDPERVTDAFLEAFVSTHLHGKAG